MLSRLSLAVLLIMASSIVSRAGQAAAQACPIDVPQVASAFTNLLKDMPQKDEIVPLLTKADEKISDFERIVNAMKANLNKANPGVITKLSEGANRGHQLIAGQLANGHNIVGLLGVLSVLDDLSRSASRESVLLLLDGGITQTVATQVTFLSSAGNALYDISELVFHTTFRAVNANETFALRIADALK